MLPTPLLRSLLPGQNAFGFSSADIVVLALAVLLVTAFLAGSHILRAARFLNLHRPAAALLLFAIPVVIRVSLLNQHPIPIPRVADDFSYILLGDTLAHFRLANASHPLHQFFEAVFVLQQPAYASIFPLGQGMVLAIGQLLFHQPWIGLLLTSGVLAAAVYWMLLAWVPAEWALAGGFIAALQFGALNPWVNTYWGGAVSAVAGCLIFGSIRRSGRPAAILLGAGLALQLLTRPFEFVLLLPALLLFRPPRRMIGIATLLVLPAAGLTLLQNKQITGAWLTLPYQLSRYQYGVPTTFTFQPDPVPHRMLSVEQQLDYNYQSQMHGSAKDTASHYLGRLVDRIYFYRFFYYPALYLALPLGLIAALLKRRRRNVETAMVWIPVLASLAILCIGYGFYPYFYPHYIASVTSLLILLAVESLRRLSAIRLGPHLVAVILTICVAHFVYALTPGGADDFWNGLNQRNPENRATIQAILDASPGPQLVFVRYSAKHRAEEWIHNAADIDRARVVWAIDQGDEQNSVLRRYYPSRRAWLLEADVRPPHLVPYAKP